MSKSAATPVPLGAWLSDLPDDGLIRLLRLRPDLTQPPPSNMSALAARAQARQSVRATTDDLDFQRLAVLDALLTLQADKKPVPVAALLDLIGERAPQDSVLIALDDLKDRALAWGTDQLRVAAELVAGLPWFPGQVAMDHSTAPMTTDEFDSRYNALSDAEKDLLTVLAEGSPVGRTRDAAPGTPPERPVPRLLAAGLLHKLDDETVMLPRQVGQLLRGEQPDPVTFSAPTTEASTALPMTDVDAAGAGAAIDLMHEVDVILRTLSETPISELRSGGLGVREMKRLAKLSGVKERRLGLILEIAYAAGLIANGVPDPEPDTGTPPWWAPTSGADRYTDSSTAARWQVLAGTWFDLPARPSLIGERGPDAKPYVALSHSLYSSAAPLDRRLLLEVLDELPPGTVVSADHVSKLMVWRRPRWSARLQPGPVADLMEEAHALGLIGRGALTSAARALLADPENVLTAMESALPEPIDHFLLQADLTVVVPGPLEREVSDDLAAVADVESAGVAMVYRVSEPTIRRALDAGRTAGQLQAFFTKHSRTPVPQGLSYLIDDVARRHGQLRAGIAASFVRCEDPTLLTQAMSARAVAGLELRLLAPTVAVSQAPLGDVLAALRAAGLAPAAEDAAGSIVDLRALGARIHTQQQRRFVRHQPSIPNDEHLAAIVAVLRQVGDVPSGRLDPARAITLLQQAARDQATVLMGYQDPAGMLTHRVVAPINVRGGQLVAYDQAAGKLREFAIHRVTSVVSAQSE